MLSFHSFTYALQSPHPDGILTRCWCLDSLLSKAYALALSQSCLKRPTCYSPARPAGPSLSTPLLPIRRFTFLLRRIFQASIRPSFKSRRTFTSASIASRPIRHSLSVLSCFHPFILDPHERDLPSTIAALSQICLAILPRAIDVNKLIAFKGTVIRTGQPKELEAPFSPTSLINSLASPFVCNHCLGLL